MTPQPDTEITLPPDTDLRALVAAILEHAEGNVPPELLPAHLFELYMTRLVVIHDTAERLAVALAQREAVTGEMAKALKALLKQVPRRAAEGCNCNMCRDGDYGRAALAKYEARHV